MIQHALMGQEVVLELVPLVNLVVLDFSNLAITHQAYLLCPFVQFILFDYQKSLS